MRFVVFFYHSVESLFLLLQFLPKSGMVLVGLVIFDVYTCVWVQVFDYSCQVLEQIITIIDVGTFNSLPIVYGLTYYCLDRLYLDQGFFSTMNHFPRINVACTGHPLQSTMSRA